jgi:hypothetical protein
MLINAAFQRIAALSFSLLFPFSLAFAVDTHVWQQDDAAEFTKGTIKNLSIRSDGRVTLAPVFRELADTGIPYLWSVVEDSHGTLYCAGGAPTGASTKILAVTPQGKSRVAAEVDGLEIHALAIDRKDRLYAATSPDSKVYRIDADGKPELFFDPNAKYIWAMVFDKTGNLYVATGDQGVIYRVTPGGKGSEFFRTEEAHARSMILDAKGDLIVGTEPGGYVLRITPQGKSFVLFQTSKREVTALAERNGVLYAAAAGARQPALTVPAPNAPKTPAVAGASTAVKLPAGKQAAAASVPSSLPPAAPAAALAGSDFYRIESDGSAEKWWASPSDVIYAIGFDGHGLPLLGTGNKGIVYRVDSATLSTQLLTAPPTQVTAFLGGQDEVLYAVTGNVGKLYAIGPGYEKNGNLESEVLDVDSFAYWGRAHLLGNFVNGKAELSTRSGNVHRPQKNWSDWTAVPMSPAGGQIASPPARFLQYRLTLTSGPQGESPVLSSVQLAYLPKNIAPVVRAIEIADANYRASTSPSFLERNVNSSGSPLSLTLPPIGQRNNAQVQLSGAPGLTVQYAKGYVTVRWEATDENNDSLKYKVEIQAEGENVWRLLKDSVEDKYLSFDGSALPDGKYAVRVTASDGPSNTPAEALSASLVSDPFTIDNTPPEISSISGAKREGSDIVVRFEAKDALSWIDKAEYSINGGDWVLVNPIGRVTDSQQLQYELKVPTSAKSGAEMIAVRVFDENDNVSVKRFTAAAR